MLEEVLVRLVFVVGLSIIIGLIVIVGSERLVQLRSDWYRRLVAAAPSFGVLIVVLIVNNAVRRVGPDISWIIGWEVTDSLYRIEGGFIIWLQSMETPVLTMFFSYVYIYGYVFLLLFPLVAYLALEDNRPLRITAQAYAFNYAIGLVCYLVIIAYGPRNMMPDLVEPLLYSTFPEYQHLTRQVNRNTNVLPSLHTSLSVTVAIISYHTRDVYPYWTILAVLLAISVAISTMYLGIHWAVDVLAGLVLATVSVVLARQTTR